MPTHTVELRCAVTPSFRTTKAGALFDLAIPRESVTSVRAATPPVFGRGSDWRVGAIVGPSGEGKSTVARTAYGDRFVERFRWPKDRSVLDGFPERMNGERLEVERIAGLLTAVGFGSPPAWLRPYRTLSTGQRFRADLARALCLGGEVVAVDEFGATVTQQVAEAAARSVAKAVRADRAGVRRFVAVGARSEFVRWLEPDWVLDMGSRTLSRGWVRRELERNRRDGVDWFDGRPEVTVAVETLGRDAKRALWPRFARHHYLDHQLHPGARAWAAVVDGQAVGFCATVANLGRRGRRRVTRLVVLPDYQGLGVGMALLEAVAHIESGDGWAVSIRSSHPGLIGALRRREGWVCLDVEREGRSQTRRSTRTGSRLGSPGRCTVAFGWSGGLAQTAECG